MGIHEFYQRYFQINLNDYANIGIDLEITKVLFYFLIGLIVATVIVNIKRASESTLIKKLMRHEATLEENAKTLDELKINTPLIRLALSSDGRLSKIVKRVGKREYTYEEYSALIKTKGYKEEKVDYSTAKFYIDSERLADASKIADTRSDSPINTVLFCVLLVAIYICISMLIPEILTFVNNMLEK